MTAAGFVSPELTAQNRLCFRANMAKPPGNVPGPWTSCRERLPEPGVPVLTKVDGPMMAEAVEFTEPMKIVPPNSDDDWSGWQWADGRNVVLPILPTHWKEYTREETT